ncbi:uncharacterized protein EKO05_0002240 [Ascochyta rabiei]|uniref:Uncharacterized protein n=1 Tax=Didymella rabiei TaxID=5454 RepID=A0A163JDK3_DIDRA|nr:uncharacterized protein EKO05_0002240 [Ascochyta rabiei]KZM26294.1 hypothetical protein ST47_g2603 [Ascochyta rabiei]UPX11646.1 hypothetical protein EKO05_0002240 [Ascochyta rabiei]
MVYITSDLFGPVDTHNQSYNYWHTMTDSQQHVAGLGKRKRLQETDVSHPNRGAHPQHSPAFEHNNDRSYASYAPAPDRRTSEHRPVKQIKRASHKLAFVKSTSHLMDTDTPMGLKIAQSQQHAVTDLRACHACKSAPRRKRDLENYMDCMRCHGRTCFICARQCLGVCGMKVCRECTSEVGEEGDSWCLDCFQRDQYLKHC